MKRRDFVRLGALSTGAVAVGGCASDTPEELVRQRRRGTGERVPREAVPGLAEETARSKLAICHHCAQSTFLALQEVFGLEGDQIVKALTPIPGIAERGETCGALLGSLMALGLVYGRDNITDWEGWRASLVPARTFTERFEEVFESTSCSDVVHHQFGARYDLYDPEDLRHFQANDPTEKCGEVVGTAARLAAELIMEKGG